MSTGNWIQLDERRSSWLFLVIGGNEPADDSDAVEPEATTREYWEVGVGNAQSLVQTSAAQIGYDGITTRDELINELMAELDHYRYQDTLLVTRRHETIQRLRRWLLTSTREEASLRGFRHVSVETQLTEYFDQNLQDYNFEQTMNIPPRRTESNPPEVVSAGSVRSLWEFWLRLFRLLPATELAGGEL